MILQSVCTSFKVEILKGVHDLTPTTGDTFMLALYTSDADLGPETTEYTATNEVSGTGYSVGGHEVTPVTPTSSGVTAIGDFVDLTISTVTVSDVRGALVYNASKSNKAVLVLDFGVARAKTAADFVITFPAADAENAILRIR